LDISVSLMMQQVMPGIKSSVRIPAIVIACDYAGRHSKPRPKKKKCGLNYYAYAVYGVAHWSLQAVSAAYRRRFSIESGTGNCIKCARGLARDIWAVDLSFFNTSLQGPDLISEKFISDSAILWIARINGLVMGREPLLGPSWLKS